MLRLTELEFVPEPPKVIKMSDELIQTLSWLTAATNYDRKFLRCNAFGALLVGNAWDNMVTIEDQELNPLSGTPANWGANVEHSGVLIATGTQAVKIYIILADQVTTETFYLSAQQTYFFPHYIFGITIYVVPDPGGTTSYVGVTTYK